MNSAVKRLAGTMAALALAGTASVAVASPAGAATAGCNVVSTHCESSTVRANSDGHFIRYWVDAGYITVSGCSWRVVDDGNGVIVGAGRIGALGAGGGVIWGLYGYYRLELYNCAVSAWGEIYNTL